MAKKYVQIPTAYLSGAGVIIGATSVTINSFTDIYGNVLTMTDFGDTGYCTVEPDTTNEESFTFTSITANANGTVTLGGIKTSLAKSPYTETTGLLRAHVGGSKVVVSDTAAFWNTFANKYNDETVTGLWTFTQNPIGLNPGAIADASTTVMGASRSSVAPSRTIGTFTVTIASPAIFTLNSHGLTVNDRVQFTTTGSLPTGLSTATTYYVISAGLTTNNFEVSTTQGGSAVNTSGSQSGTHTLIRTTPIFVGDNDIRVPTADPTTLFAPITVASPPSGMVSPYAGNSAPSGWLLCDGSAVSRTTYATLFSVVSTTFGSGDGSTTFNVPDLRSRSVVGVGTGTKVATFASRASNVITVTGLTNAANNEFQTGCMVRYSTSGSVITGLTNNTDYYVIRVTNTSFSLATSLANANAGTAITLSSDGTGTQTFTKTFTARTRGDTGGEENHLLNTTELASHRHQETVTDPIGSNPGIPAYTGANIASGPGIGAGANSGQGGVLNTVAAGGDTPHSIMQPFVALNYIIKV